MVRYIVVEPNGSIDHIDSPLVDLDKHVGSCAQLIKVNYNGVITKGYVNIDAKKLGMKENTRFKGLYGSVIILI